MTEPKLCPTTLRWAAQRIRKFLIPRLDLGIQAAQDDAFELAAESLDNWATEAELAEAKRMATSLVLEPALTVDQHYGRIAYYGFAGPRGADYYWGECSYEAQLDWIRAAKAVCVEMSKAMKAVRGGL